MWLAEVSNDSCEFMKWNEESLLPKYLWNDVNEASERCLLIDKFLNSFEIMALMSLPYFEGEKYKEAMVIKKDTPR